MNLFIYQFELASESTTNPGFAIGDIHPKTAAELDFKEWLVFVEKKTFDLIVVSNGQQDPQRILDTLIKNQVFAENQTTFKNLLMDQKAVTRFFQIATGVIDSRDNGTDSVEKLQAAYLKAVEKAHIGSFIHYLFQRGIWLHEKVRQETRYFRFAVQKEKVFKELAKKILDSLNQATVYVMGNDPILPKVLEDLRTGGCERFIFFEEDENKDSTLVAKFSGLIQQFGSFIDSSSQTDILLHFTSEKEKYIYDSLIQKVNSKLKSPLVIFNFSDAELPTDEIKKNSNIYLYGQEDIEYVVEYNRAQQETTAKEIRGWISNEVKAFKSWLTSDVRFQFSGIIGAHPKMQRIFELVSRISQTDITVLIDGESGTGKELVAKAVHQLSTRSHQPFVVVNCGAIPENLLESELFGHVKGAFTDAVAQKIGLFEEANGGTIFLDEIAELSPNLQVKLLRVLQDGEIKPVGSNESLNVNVRVLAATNKDIAAMVDQGTFRSDLYYRINVIRLTIPPLRERSDDIPFLATHFLKKYSKKQKKNVPKISDQAMEKILEYRWPGNVRELENVLEHAVAMAIGNSISLYDLPQNLQDINGSLRVGDSENPATLKEVEKSYILEILENCNWNYDVACKQLGIGRTTLWRKLKEYKMVKS